MKHTCSSTLRRTRKHRIHRCFTLRHHVNLIVECAPRLLSLLFHGTPRWLFKLVRLLAFVMALLPGFVVFAYYYFWSADRIALPYREDGVVGDASNDGDDPSRNSPRTSRHFVDVYGSRTALTMRNDGRDISYDRQCSSVLTTCNDMSSGENGGNGDEESKPVVIFFDRRGMDNWVQDVGSLVGSCTCSLGCFGGNTRLQKFPSDGCRRHGGRRR